MSRTTLLFLLLFVPALAASQWSNGQNAAHVLGQADFTSGTGSTSDNTLKFSSLNGGGVTIDFTTSKMYVADCANNRVLRFSYPAGGFTSNQPTAEAVFGQANFTTSGAATTSTTMSQPADVFALRDTLWVADYLNNRVTGFFNASTITSGAAADLVLGQPDFTTASSGTTAAKMNTPSSVTVDGAGNVYVAEYNNNRVLKFNKGDLANGASAAVVFGQPNKTSAAPGTGAANLLSPWKILIKNNSLFVTEYTNNRVMRYDNISAATDGYAGSNIFGNTVMAAGSSGLTQASVPFASGIAIDDNNRLYVSGWSTNRVMIFPDAFTATNGPNALNVIGQSVFTTNDFGTTQSTFHFISSLFVDSPNKHLYVVDIINNRIMQFTASNALPVELTSFTGITHGGSVELNWKTATETDNYGFEVERSSMTNEQSSMNNWAKVGFVEGAGNTNAPREYLFADKNVRGGRYSYRLKQIDRNGSFKYTEAVTVEILAPRELTLSQNYPNPFNPTTVIEFSVPEDGRVSLRIFDALGREVATLVNGPMKGGVLHQATFDASKYSSGIYFAQLQSGTKMKLKKLMLVK